MAVINAAFTFYMSKMQDKNQLQHRSSTFGFLTLLKASTAERTARRQGLLSIVRGWRRIFCKDLRFFLQM